MEAKRLLGTVAAVLLAGGMAAVAEPRGPQDIGQEGALPPGGLGGAMMDRSGPMGPPPMGGPGGARMAMGEERHGPMGHPPMGLDVERAKKAGATEAQIQALEDFEFEQSTKRIDLQATAEKADLKLNHLIKAQTADEKAIFQAVDVLNQARGDVFKLEIASMLKAKQVLGEAVLQKLHDMGPPSAMGHGMPDPRGGNKQPADRNEGPGPAHELK